MRVVYILYNIVTVFITVFTVFTYQGVYTVFTVFTYEGVYTVFTVFTYESVYVVFRIRQSFKVRNQLQMHEEVKYLPSKPS